MSSPSGAGKTTLSRKLIAADGNIAMSISVTTRKPRPGEVDGKDYYFLSEPEFKRRIDNGAFVEWVKARPHIQNWIVVGDCTDLCTYQLAMYLRTAANENQQRGVRIILPEDCVDTYDLPVATAQQIGATPHGAEMLHLIFLYHMMLNGIEVVSTITT